jgi:hypothetical protein
MKELPQKFGAFIRDAIKDGSKSGNQELRYAALRLAGTSEVADRLSKAQKLSIARMASKTAAEDDPRDIQELTLKIWLWAFLGFGQPKKRRAGQQIKRPGAGTVIIDIRNHFSAPDTGNKREP